ncbi:MAG TPA: hypothetical protein VFB95_12600 [Candidatus Cryosericum sp.]|nr:hypothetical protein [Candidatus Cryosericum sp.]
MTQFTVEDILTIGEVAGDNSALTERLGQMIDHSSNVRADVECLSTKTGEYRIVLRGTVRQEPPAWEQRDQRPEGEWAENVAAVGTGAGSATADS